MCEKAELKVLCFSIIQKEGNGKYPHELFAQFGTGL